MTYELFPQFSCSVWPPSKTTKFEKGTVWNRSRLYQTNRPIKLALYGINIHTYVEIFIYICKHIYTYIFLDAEFTSESITKPESFKPKQNVFLKYENIVKSMYTHTSGKVTADKQSSQDFNKVLAVSQGFSTSPFKLCRYWYPSSDKGSNN